MTTVPSPLPVFEHRLMALRRTWRGNIFTSFLLPILFLLGMGVSVGAYVDRGGTLGVPYLDYVAPGLMASTAVQIAVGESMWPILNAFVWNRLYHAMRASPLRAADIVGGEFAYLMVRVGIPATSFLIVMAAFGVVGDAKDSAYGPLDGPPDRIQGAAWELAAVPAAILVGAAMAGAIMAYSASIKSDNMFALLFRFAVIPMTLFAGVFFPVHAMPLVARWIAYASPLWHGVELCRYATAGVPSTLPPIWHVAYLLLWAVAGYVLARWRFAKRLTD
ncbi:MAG: lipooligosaccharide transport system permease protein [Micromonosporaceae bacterium]|nr:lipooligosaccharide transport system permease protein [Micromonosporaceae bacterium]